MTTLLTVITISFNQAEFIEDCLNSTECVESNEIQHIVIDAGSSDKSRKILLEREMHRNNLELIFEEDRGPADGLNKGIMRAKGEWICFLNSDDFFLENGLERLIRIIRNSKGYDFIYGHGLKFNGNKIEPKIVSKFSELFFVGGQLKMFQQSMSFRTAFIRENGIELMPVEAIG